MGRLVTFCVGKCGKNSFEKPQFNLSKVRVQCLGEYVHTDGFVVFGILVL